MTNDNLPPQWISDADLIRLIERVTRRAATLADAKVWRRAIERERARRSRALHGLPPVLRSADVESAHDIIIDFLLSPEGQAMIGILLVGRSLAESLLDDAGLRLYKRLLAQRALARDILPDLAGLHRYACEKLAPGGRRPVVGRDFAHALPGLALAALNAATPAALAEWRDRLAATSRSPATQPHVLARLRDTGLAVMREHPDLDIGHPMAGASLGIWPPPPPEEGLDGDTPGTASPPLGLRP